MNEQARDVIEINAPQTPAPVASASEVGAILSMIERAARDPNVDIEKFERLMAMRERVEAMKERADERAAQAAFSAAISAAKGEIEPITRNAKGHNDKKYADFGAIARAIDPILSKNGLSYRFRSSQGDKISVTCIISHRDGHSEENTLSGLSDTSGSKNAIQSIGSTLTYLQRYTLVLSLGLASSADDDGRASRSGATIEAEPELVSSEQIAAIQAKIAALGVDPVKFREHIKVESLADIRADKFGAAMNLLDQRAAAKRTSK